MSYDVEMRDPLTNDLVQVPAFTWGGIVKAQIDIVTGELIPIPETEAEINLTYNYQRQYCKVFGHHWGLYQIIDGKTGAECIPLLCYALSLLGVAVSEYYWQPSPGNAGVGLAILLEWAILHPDAVFHVS